MWGIILALISGALMSIQGVFNTEVTKQTSLWVSTGFVQLTVVQSMRSLGPAQAVIIIVTSQVAVAYLIELFGLFGSSQASFSWRKILGLLIAIAGIVLFRWEKA